MKISEILKEDFIIADLKTTDKESTLEELCKFLESRGVIKNKDEVLNALIEREKLGSTGIGDNVAIPHAKSNEINELTCLFARSEHGIEFDSLDQKPVHFICLLLAPIESTGIHLKALARIARIFKNQDLRNKILKTSDTRQIFNLLIEEDAKFI